MALCPRFMKDGDCRRPTKKGKCIKGWHLSGDAAEKKKESAKVALAAALKKRKDTKVEK